MANFPTSHATRKTSPELRQTLASPGHIDAPALVAHRLHRATNPAAAYGGRLSSYWPRHTTRDINCERSRVPLELRLADAQDRISLPPTRAFKRLPIHQGMHDRLQDLP
jgi:hypothetical protein